ncbi:MAG: trimeric intracellular cation channel family protein [Planctomycetes bacterium]|nr:trimeric intracellular cation channel family protein [Planctomycetota bacterium]
MNLFRIIDLIGVSVFAVSGALKAREKHLDPVGFITLGVVTATGGGVLRDAILGRVPPFVFRDEWIFGVAVAVSLAIFFVKVPAKRLEYFDALGLGFYTAMGAQLAADKGLPTIPAILVGVTAACGGGVMREVLVNDLPFIFRGTLFATASIAGAAALLIARKFGAPDALALTLGFITTAGIRILAIRKQLTLPVPAD